MKILFVGDSHTWSLSKHDSVLSYQKAISVGLPSPVPVGTVGFHSSEFNGHKLDFLWKTGMNANDAKYENLKLLFDKHKLCPCSYDFVVFGFGDMDIQFKYRVRTMSLAATAYFNGVVSVMQGYLDKIIFRDPTTRLTSKSQNYQEFMSKLFELCQENNFPDPIMTMDNIFGGIFKSSDSIGHLSNEDGDRLKKYIIDELAAIYN